MKPDGRNGSDNGNSSEEREKGRRRFKALIAIIILLLLLFLLFQWKIGERNKRLEDERVRQEYALKQSQLELAIEKARKIADSIIREDSLKKKDDSVAKTPAQQAPAQPAQPAREAPQAAAPPQAAPAPQQSDSIPPVPSILPPPGRYYKPVNLRVECGEPKCRSEISAGDSLNPQGDKIDGYNKTGNVYFRALDSAGNASPWETASYDMASDNSCAENSYPVPVKGKTVCVDAYAFPNKAGEKPRNMVSQGAASRLCEDAGKRLCSADEWQAACKGKSGLRYPYGNSYNPSKCATDLKSAKEPLRSGFAEHCRSWYGMYDMSGNVWEWTSTPAQREGLFLAAGGAWNTQNASSCAETKFSFYPQNEYPFVGFRCCK